MIDIRYIAVAGHLVSRTVTVELRVWILPRSSLLCSLSLVWSCSSSSSDSSSCSYTRTRLSLTSFRAAVCFVRNWKETK